MNEKEKLKRFLFELVRIESVSGNELLAVKYINDMFHDLGFISDVQYVSESSFNLIINDISDPDLLIATHVDTIPVISRARIIGDDIYGTGAVDAKGSIAAIYYALTRVNRLPSNISIAIFSQEETSGGGAISYLKDHFPKHALILEPTNLELFNGANGYLEILFEINDEHYHPDLIRVSDIDRTAIMRSLKLIEGLRAFSMQSNLTFTITNINASGGNYFVPSSCKFIVNFHIPPSKKPLIIYEQIKEFILRNNLISDNDDVRLIDYANPFRTLSRSLISVFLKAYKKIFGKEPVLGIFRSWCDATTFYERMVPSLIFGPGQPYLAHNDREHINVIDVMKAGELIAELIRLMDK